MGETYEVRVMDWELARDLFQVATLLVGWVVLFGVAVFGLVFAVAFTCWCIDKIRKDWDL